MATRVHLAFTLLILPWLAAAAPPDELSEEATNGAQLFFNGTIVTMEGNAPEVVESVVARDGRVVYVGPLTTARSRYGQGANSVDLRGRTMLPGFIEPHAHPVSIGATILANEIVAPHEWRMPHQTYAGVSGQKDYLEAVARIMASKGDAANTVLIWGYHKAWHGELTLADLDRVTGAVPTIIWQRSTHEVYLNTAAARKYGVEKGVLQETEQVDWNNLHFWERAYQELKGSRLSGFFADPAMLQRGMSRMTQMMTNNGLVAMAEPSFPNASFDIEYALLKAETDSAKAYSIYLIPGFPEQFTMGMDSAAYRKRVESFPNFNTEHITFLPGQYKTFADGAI